jgi:hypothetical protein
MGPLRLSDRLRYEPEAIVCHTPSAKERCRVQAFLWLAEWSGVDEVAERLHVSRHTVYKWVSRFQGRDDLGVRACLLDAPRPGRPPTAGGLPGVSKVGSPSITVRPDEIGRWVLEEDSRDGCRWARPLQSWTRSDLPPRLAR